jgi:hypothetical protein
MPAETVAAVVRCHRRSNADALSITVPAVPGTSTTGPHADGIGESASRNLAEAHCEEMNRPVRTRTPGGVGGASEQSGSLVSRSWFAATSG